MKLFLLKGKIGILTSLIHTGNIHLLPGILVLPDNTKKVLGGVGAGIWMTENFNRFNLLVPV